MICLEIKALSRQPSEVCFFVPSWLLFCLFCFFTTPTKSYTFTFSVILIDLPELSLTLFRSLSQFLSICCPPPSPLLVFSFTRRPTQDWCCFMCPGICQAPVPPRDRHHQGWIGSAASLRLIIDQCSSSSGSHDLTSRVTSAHIHIKLFLKTFQRRSERQGRHPAPPPPVFTMVISGSYPPGWR